MNEKIKKFIPKKIKETIRDVKRGKKIRTENYYDSLIKTNINLDEQGYKINVNRWFGRLGNNLIQICNAINIALNTKSIVIFPKYTSKLLKKLHKLDFSNPNKCNITINGYFYFPEHCYGFYTSLSERRRILLKYIHPILNLEYVNNVNENSLVINIRSGDMFEKNTPHSTYFQPPLSFYKYIINHGNYDDIIIVTEKDLKNPCIRGLLKWNKDIILTTPSPEMAASMLLKAKHLVIGTSTFSLMLSLLSRNIKYLHICNPEYKWNSQDYSIIFYKLKNYPNDNWKCSPEQLKLMMEYSIDDIEIVQR